MTVVLRASHLTTFSVAPDGASVSLGMSDEAGEPLRIVLPAKCLQAMVLTLPDMAQQALRRQTGDPGKRLVFPVASYELEKAIGSSRLILSFKTSDGFAASFAIEACQLAQIALTAFEGDETEIAADTPETRHSSH